jgi:hypothetical protein
VTAGGSHTLLLIVNQGARVWIDDQLVIDEPDGTRKRSGKKQALTLTEGLHPFRVEFWDGGGLARIRLLWTPPAGTEQVIPASAFFHEVGAEQ